jgi:hypothetical protein
MALTVPSPVELTSVTVAPCEELPCLGQVYATHGNEGSEKVQQTTALSSKCGIDARQGSSKHNRVDIENGTMVGVVLIEHFEATWKGRAEREDGMTMRCYVIYSKMTAGEGEGGEWMGKSVRHRTDSAFQRCI